MALIMLLAMAACENVGFRTVSSYEMIQERFNVDAKPGVVYPNLSALHFEESTVKYRYWPDYKDDGTLLADEFFIEGESTVAEHPIHCCFLCRKEQCDTRIIEDPIKYKDKEIRFARNIGPQNAYIDGYYVEINGYEYGIHVVFNQDGSLSDAEIEDVGAQAREIYLPFIYGIIDEAEG